MDKIEHLGIAVEDLESAMKTYTALFGAPAYKVEEVASEGVRTAFFRSGPNKIELLEGIGTQNPISRFIAKKGEGIHHVAFAVEDIRSAMDRLASEGFTLLSQSLPGPTTNSWPLSTQGPPKLINSARSERIVSQERRCPVIRRIVPEFQSSDLLQVKPQIQICSMPRDRRPSRITRRQSRGLAQSHAPKPST